MIKTRPTSPCSFPTRHLHLFPLLCVLWTLCSSSPAHTQITTAQYDNARTGAHLKETILTPQNVNSRQFGKLFTLQVDGDVYAQPLYLPGLQIPGKGKHNVIFLATEHDSAYAFDADTQGAPLWHVNFTNASAGIDTVPARDVRCPFIRPEVGITPTPVIDAQSGTLYALARTKESGAYVQKLHALDVLTGAEKFGSPVVIKASLSRKVMGVFNGTTAFDPLRENPRAALLLSNGKIYLTWGSSCDVGPYYGWVMAYDAKSLAQVAVFNAAPDGEEAGIWQSDAGPAADQEGNIYPVTGNGKFDASSGGRDYGDSALKLALNQNGFVLRDYFTPFDQQRLNDEDLDLGSLGPLLFPDQPGAHPHLLITGDKAGNVYLIDRDQMGKYHAGDNSHAVQTLHVKGGCYGAAAYWNQNLFIVCSEDSLKDFKLAAGKLSSGPVMQSAKEFANPGATLTVSANGTKNGIVWLVETKAWNAPDQFAVLHAYDAANVGRELYSSSQDLARDGLGLAVRFVIPTIMKGRVYIGAKRELDVYGLLPGAAKKH
ncbi:MAG TPA: hypothetical protein VM912_22015 [Terriglobales bacterium]|nr:hypothetical protein [Terriglobales bacterium]